MIDHTYVTFDFLVICSFNRLLFESTTCVFSVALGSGDPIVPTVGSG